MTGEMAVLTGKCDGGPCLRQAGGKNHKKHSWGPRKPAFIGPTYRVRPEKQSQQIVRTGELLWMTNQVFAMHELKPSNLNKQLRNESGINLSHPIQRLFEGRVGGREALKLNDVALLPYFSFRMPLY